MALAFGWHTFGRVGVPNRLESFWAWAGVEILTALASPANLYSSIALNNLGVLERRSMHIPSLSQAEPIGAGKGFAGSARMVTRTEGLGRTHNRLTVDDDGI
jgi:hypothetical protein